MRSRVLLVGALVGSLSASLLMAPAHAGPTRKRRARVATRYVVRQQRDSGAIPAFSKVGSTADAITSLVAARRSHGAINDAVRWLRRHDGRATTVGLQAKVVLALVAAGRDPADFAKRDWISDITGTETANGRYGATTPVFEDVLALLALQAAGVTPSAQAISWLVNAQCADGGWQFDKPYRAARDNQHCVDVDADPEDPFRSEADATALAIQALDALATDPATNPFKFLRTLRDPIKHGWGYNADFTLTNANSTALVLQAYAAENRDLPHRGVRALKRLQYPLCGKGAGAFAYSWIDNNNDGKFRRSGRDVGATIGAIPALLGKPLPIRQHDVTTPAPKPGPC